MKSVKTELVVLARMLGIWTGVEQCGRRGCVDLRCVMEVGLISLACGLHGMYDGLDLDQ